MWVSETSVVCQVGAGASGSLVVSVTAGAGAGTVSGEMSYDGSLASVVAGANVGTTGGDSVSVMGQGLGSSRCLTDDGFALLYDRMFL